MSSTTCSQPDRQRCPRLLCSQPDRQGCPRLLCSQPDIIFTNNICVKLDENIFIDCGALVKT